MVKVCGRRTVVISGGNQVVAGIGREGLFRTPGSVQQAGGRQVVWHGRCAGRRGEERNKLKNNQTTGKETAGGR